MARRHPRPVLGWRAGRAGRVLWPMADRLRSRVARLFRERGAAIGGRKPIRTKSGEEPALIRNPGPPR
jgi:hypothetical protein